ncbi:unnamed protein product, partial [Ixodes hexagonus]
ALRWGRRVSQRQTLRFSLECPAVAIRLDELTKAKSLACFEWHEALKKGLAFGDVTPTCRLRLPSPSVTPNLLPCWLNRRLVTLANVPASLGVDTGWACPPSHRLTEPSWQPDKYSGSTG